MTFEAGVVHRTQPHLLADLAEILLVAGYDNLEELSQAKLELLSKELPLAADEDASDIPTHSLDLIESTDRCIEDCWLQLEYRVKAFQDFYPFQVKSNILSWKDSVRSPEQCIYVFLLICSRLRSFPLRGFAQRAAKAFTFLSCEAMRSLAGPLATVRIFDANSHDRKTYYGTDLRKAMARLAKDLGAHSFHDDEVKKLPSSGDYGLDLVSVRSFADGATGAHAIFGQCGAQEINWPAKTLEAHPLKFQGLFTLLNQPDNLVFIPVCYRDSSGGWVAGHRLSGCLLVDRIRILALLRERWDKVSSAISDQAFPILGEIVNCGRSIPKLKVKTKNSPKVV
jgi:hypothetical protein